jgi:uncharacterized coiled-coil protein SlyX
MIGYGTDAIEVLPKFSALYESRTADIRKTIQGLKAPVAQLQSQITVLESQLSLLEERTPAIPEQTR